MADLCASPSPPDNVLFEVSYPTPPGGEGILFRTPLTHTSCFLPSWPIWGVPATSTAWWTLWRLQPYLVYCGNSRVQPAPETWQELNVYVMNGDLFSFYMSPSETCLYGNQAPKLASKTFLIIKHWPVDQILLLGQYNLILNLFIWWKEPALWYSNCALSIGMGELNWVTVELQRGIAWDSSDPWMTTICWWECSGQNSVRELNTCAIMVWICNVSPKAHVLKAWSPI